MHVEPAAEQLPKNYVIIDEIKVRYHVDHYFLYLLALIIEKYVETYGVLPVTCHTIDTPTHVASLTIHHL